MWSILRTGAFVASVLIIVYGVVRTEDRADPRWLLLLGLIGCLWFLALWTRFSPRLGRTTVSLVHVALALCVGFGLVTVQVLRAQILDRDRILARAANPASGIVDIRRYLDERRTERGRILLRDGTVIARDEVRSDGSRYRVYEGASAYLAGYYSPALFGAAGIEAAYDSVLSGQAALNWETWLDGVLHRPRRGNDVILTIDSRLQELGQTLLGD
ncbi:MAG: hypothetical protein NZ562_06500, partial [Thermomicrobium sp.]|nr:hypothetical protein [Thermomicrobium sp.]